jgi:cbb3-type cytochrome oxidase maturation protein
VIVIFLLIPLSIVIAICFFAAFIWAVRSGQYEDTCTPSMRLLLEEKRAKNLEPAKPSSRDLPSLKHTRGAKNE